MDKVQALTVGELRRAISKIPDETTIVIDSNGWYDNIQGVIIPNGGSYECVTLMPSTMMATNNEHGNWDTRQWGSTTPSDIREDESQ